ncbi:S-layer homology domain-containing protein [Chakrabartyella piscis]|uniref:S-layer homology domain-containing protein n=1 Tax=Chakrabartyella piscis TaxID=2918914 RepID=UPI00295849B1|nr:S-layer homology domain-containing protein [Chakrabartyella piscis]
MKRKLIVLSTILSLALSTTVFASTTFSDVPDNHFASESISILAEKGLVSGSIDSATGVSSFNPEGAITYGEVLSLATRLVVPESIDIGAYVDKYGEDHYHWATDYYIAAAKTGIIDDDDLSHLRISRMMYFGTTNGIPYLFNAEVTREEMAVLLCDAAAVNGETLVADENIGYAIADYPFIHEIDAVKKVYTAGLMDGVDEIGTFDKDATITRAEVAVIFCRLMNYIDRIDVTIDVPTDSNGKEITFEPIVSTIDSNGVMTIYEGAIRDNRNAQAGDIVIKTDGTQVVLKYGPNGILGENQGVAADLGLMNCFGQPLQNGWSYGSPDHSMTDSFGNSLNNQTYKLNPITECAHWSSELQHIDYPSYDGTFVGELSPDRNWMWSSLDWWLLCYNTDPAKVDVDAILELNGLS